MADSMDVDVFTAEATAVSPSSNITILRIKRKRDAEQLEALVIDPARRKRVRPSTGLFTYAGTLEEGADLDAIQQELATLRQQQDASPAKTAPVNPPATERLIAPQPSRKYTVVRSKGDGAPPSQTASANQMTVYDAVPDDAPLDPADAPEELQHFLPMLESYLKSHADDSLHDRPSDAGAVGEDDYVYDVYVHRAGAGLQSAAAYTNIGSVSGLPTALEDAWDSDDDMFAGDTEDEDSNDEDFYRNDYPDERSDDSASDGGHDRFSDGEGEYIEDPEAYAHERGDDDDDVHQPEMHKFAGRNAVAYW
ncbi:hypothetical protein AURDEDRAFT_182343 [Auricularia subglabra TFB-10046 SS5]|nr:hypothetical protein AURDEDRAFT_182343 [Auricularia subglabra TFB-10046 SS5]